MPRVIINGRSVNLPNAIKGNELIKRITTKKDRRPVMTYGTKTEEIKSNKTYKTKELMTKGGKKVQLRDMPDRTKGQTLFWGDRSEQSKEIIAEQIIDLTAHYFNRGVRFDDENFDWLVVDNYVLPEKWHNLPGVTANRVSLGIVFPTLYPQVPPIGFYMDADIAFAPEGNDHFFDDAYHEADKEFLRKGSWKWYCVYVKPNSWQPSRNWKNGDNLWTYFTLISEALNSSD